MQFFSTYQVLVTAGYENSISVYYLNPTYLDHTLVQKLVGHNSMVTAVCVIESTPMIVSADDNGIIKVILKIIYFMSNLDAFYNT